jgi:alpha-tubulin suppressor-like RCC1 family protein
MPEGELVLQASSGANHTLILLANGQVYACGANESGQVRSFFAMKLIYV